MPDPGRDGTCILVRHQPLCATAGTPPPCSSKRGCSQKQDSFRDAASSYCASLTAHIPQDPEPQRPSQGFFFQEVCLACILPDPRSQVSPLSPKTTGLYCLHPVYTFIDVSGPFSHPCHPLTPMRPMGQGQPCPLSQLHNFIAGLPPEQTLKQVGHLASPSLDLHLAAGVPLRTRCKSHLHRLLYVLMQLQRLVKCLTLSRRSNVQMFPG